MKRAVGYLRVSGQGQLQGDGFPRQRAAIEQYAATHDLQIIRFFEEQGVSGKTEWDDRPAWIDMISTLSGCTVIVVERLDRLARDLGVQEWILRELKRMKIELVSTAEPDLGAEDPTRVLFRQVLGSFAQFERAQIEAKLRAARQRKRRRGERCEGRKPYGETEAEKAVLGKMLEMAQGSYTFNEIALRLNAEGVSTRDSRRWHGATVSRILRRVTG
jgi:DNA invertase Pin-like site-specific DNA recombinase